MSRVLIVGAGLTGCTLAHRRVVFAGRLANYLYIDMDDCMRQALDAAEGEVLPALRSAAS
jgi:UDP-galactopyranose mutase